MTIQVTDDTIRDIYILILIIWNVIQMWRIDKLNDKIKKL